MRAVIQRVSNASVTIGEKSVSEIGQGLLILLGVETEDNEDDIAWLAGKISRLRVFDDASNVPNLSVQDVDGGLLVVSQFTLFASTRKGNRPSYTKAAPPEIAIPHYESFVRALASEAARPVQTGVFGADMKVALVNNGPITILMDSKARE